jgi:hypothetical protein
MKPAWNQMESTELKVRLDNLERRLARLGGFEELKNVRGEKSGLLSKS